MNESKPSVVELVAGMTQAEFEELSRLEDRLHYGNWGRAKTERAIKLLEKLLRRQQSELKELETLIPPHRQKEVRFGNDPEAHAKAIHIDHLRYDLQLTQLRMEQYQASLKHGRKQHPEISAVKAKTAAHIDQWLRRRH